MARTVYVTTFLTGGGSGLDGIDGNNILAGDVAFLINKTSTTPGREGNYFRVYAATTRSDAEDSPEIILPDANAGDWNWEGLNPLASVYHTTGKAATLPSHGISVLRTSGPTVHLLRRPRRGTLKTLVFSSTSAIKVRVTTAAAADLAAPTVRIGAVGKSTGSAWCAVVTPTSRSLQRLPPSIQLVGRSTARWEIISISNPSTGTVKANFTFSSST